MVMILFYCEKMLTIYKHSLVKFRRNKQRNNNSGMCCTYDKNIDNLACNIVHFPPSIPLTHAMFMCGDTSLYHIRKMRGFL